MQRTSSECLKKLIHPIYQSFKRNWTAAKMVDSCTVQEAPVNPQRSGSWEVGLAIHQIISRVLPLQITQKNRNYKIWLAGKRALRVPEHETPPPLLVNVTQAAEVLTELLCNFTQGLCCHGLRMWHSLQCICYHVHWASQLICSITVNSPSNWTEFCWAQRGSDKDNLLQPTRCIINKSFALILAQKH